MNLKALRDAPVTSVKLPAVVDGHSSPGDGGGGAFDFDPHCTANDDDGINIRSRAISVGRWVRRIDGGTVRASWFGVSAAKPRNDVGLANLNRWLRSNREQVLTVEFDPGTYHYENNKWLMGVGSVTFIAYDAMFKCMKLSGQYVDLRPFNNGTPFPGIGFLTSTPTGSRFRSAQSGETFVELVAASEVRQFTTGCRVLLTGYAQQYESFPPNPRFFEWNEVEAIDATSAVIRLRKRLRFPYDSTRWADSRYRVDNTAMSIGVPRLLRLDNSADQYPRSIVIKGASFNRNDAAGPNSLLLACQHLSLVDVTCDGNAVPSINETATYTNCTFAGAEPDKICDRVLFERCRFLGDIVEGTGVNDLRIERSDVRGLIRLAPRRLHLVGNRISPPSDAEYGAIQSKEVWPTDMVELRDNTVEVTQRLRHAINNGVIQDLTCQGVSPAGEISASREAALHLSLGMKLYAEGMKELGTINEIRIKDSQTVLSGSWQVGEALVQSGRVLHFCAWRKIEESGTTLRGREIPVFRHDRSFQFTGNRSTEFGLFNWPTSFTREVFGRVSELRIESYGNERQGSVLRVAVVSPSFEAEVVQAPLDVSGSVLYRTGEARATLPGAVARQMPNDAISELRFSISSEEAIEGGLPIRAVASISYLVDP